MAIDSGFEIWLLVLKFIILASLYLVTLWIYNITLHPLANFPGPLLWRASRIPYLRTAWKGHFPYIIKDMHEKYGDVVRVAPNELSFTSSAAWDDIYTNRNGNAFPKSELWYGSSGEAASSVHFITGQKEHARVRRFLAPAFSEKAVLEQEPIVQQHVTTFIDRLLERLPDANTGTTTINIVDWLHFVLFDAIGDLAFGEPFGCLGRCEYEPWMSQTNASVRFMYFTINLRHYPARFRTLLGKVFGLSFPPELLEQRKDFRQRTTAKLDRRLSTQGESDRQDIVAQLLKSEDREKGLTKQEIMLNCILFISAASETTVTTLIGAINHLLQDPTSLSELQREVRTFQVSSDLTFQAVKQLPYLDAVLREALRMCSPNPIGHMRVSPAGGGRVAGHYVPENTLVTIQPLALAYSDHHFYEAATWHPERWLNPAKTDPTSPYFRDDRKSIRAFGTGSYNCIGEALGWAEMRLILSKLVWTSDLSKAQTANATIAWHEQEVYATVVKRPLDVSLSRKKL